MRLLFLITCVIAITCIPVLAEDYRFQRAEGVIGLMDDIIDSKGVATSIRLDMESDTEALAVFGALMDAEINGTFKPSEYEGFFFDQPIILTGEFTSQVLHTKAVPNGAGSEPYRVFKVSGLKIGFPFSRLRYWKHMRQREYTVLETHFGIHTLFPRGIKHDGKKIELSRFVREEPTDPRNGTTGESIGEQGGAGQPVTRSESK